jgi:hypothetical protein
MFFEKLTWNRKKIVCCIEKKRKIIDFMSLTYSDIKKKTKED